MLENTVTLKPAKRREKRSRKESASEPVRLRSVARSGEAASSSGLHLRSATPSRQLRTGHQLEVRNRYAFASKTVKYGNSQWKSRRFSERVKFRKNLRKFLPRGSVGDSIKAQLPPDCSTCDERTVKNRPPAAEYAAQRIRAKRSQRLESIHRVVNSAKLNLKRIPERVVRNAFKSCPRLPEQEEDEEETTGDPVIDRDRDGGDGSGPDWSGDESGANVPLAATAAC